MNLMVDKYASTITNSAFYGGSVQVLVGANSHLGSSIGSGNYACRVSGSDMMVLSPAILDPGNSSQIFVTDVSGLYPQTPPPTPSQLLNLNLALVPGGLVPASTGSAITSTGSLPGGLMSSSSICACSPSPGTTTF